MIRHRVLSVFLVASAIALALGGFILRSENLVPVSLTASTIAIIGLVLSVAHFVWRGNRNFAAVGAVLAVASIIFNTAQPAHLEAILHPFASFPILILVISDLLGFYALPAAYLIVYLLGLRRQNGWT